MTMTNDPLLFSTCARRWLNKAKNLNLLPPGAPNHRKLRLNRIRSLNRFKSSLWSPAPGPLGLNLPLQRDLNILFNYVIQIAHLENCRPPSQSPVSAPPSLPGPAA